MICKNCGANNENNSTVCFKCGKPLENNELVNNNGNITNKKNNKIPYIIIGAIVILIIVIGLVSNNVMSNSNKTINNNNENSNLPNEDNSIKKRIEELKSEGYEEITFNSINIDNELNNNEIIRNFATTNGLVKLYEGTGKSYDNFTIKIENGIVGFYDQQNQKKEINITNVKNVYITDLTCGGEIDLIILDTNGKIYILNSLSTNSNLNELVLDNIKDITSANTYIDILQWKQGVDTCSVEYKIVGITNDENMYFIDSNEIVDTKKLYTTLNNIYNSQEIKVYLNRNIEINGIKENYKLKMLLGNKYILTSDNYLYDIENNNLINNKKVQLILKNESNNLNVKYTIIFNDNSSIDFQE